MNEEIANAMGDSSPAGGGNIAMPENPLRKRLRDILKRPVPTTKTIAGKNGNGGKQGSLFPNSKKKIGLGLPNENYKHVDIEKALAKAKEKRLHG